MQSVQYLYIFLVSLRPFQPKTNNPKLSAEMDFYILNLVDSVYLILLLSFLKLYQLIQLKKMRLLVYWEIIEAEI